MPPVRFEILLALGATAGFLPSAEGFPFVQPLDYISHGRNQSALRLSDRDEGGVSHHDPIAKSAALHKIRNLSDPASSGELLNVEYSER